MTKINPFSLAKESYALLWRNRRMAGAFIVIYVLVYSLVSLVPLYHIVPSSHVFFKLFTSLLLAPAVVALYQVFLAAPDERNKLYIPHDIGKKTVLLATSLFVFKIGYWLVCLKLPNFFLQPVNPTDSAAWRQFSKQMMIVGPASVLIYAYCVTKVALFFPTMVAGRSYPLRTGCKLTRGNVTRIFMGLTVAVIPVYLLSLGLAVGPTAFFFIWFSNLNTLPMWLHGMLMMAVNSVFESMPFMVATAGLSTAYKTLTDS
ncbi:hypothetical protein [Salidesulfovibrio onnuriiensis]|uniref:hypothetical protein n=1 Tax=Salidesulfovibrio onnuriiensis TaxID=2583823 RepID=UPI0011CB6E2D|nr:hypothetical protein [Salidesulfovibrio onnuriiensis]